MRIKWRSIILLLVVVGIIAGGAVLLLGRGKALAMERIPGLSKLTSILPGNKGDAASTPTPSIAATAIPADKPLVVEGMSWFVTETATATPTPKPVIKVAAPKKQATVNTDTLNMRAGPSTQHQVMGTVERGDRLEILGKNQAGDWLKVAAPGGTEAWVFAQLVTTDADLDDVPVAVAPTVPPPAK